MHISLKFLFNDHRAYTYQNTISLFSKNHYFKSINNIRLKFEYCRKNLRNKNIFNNLYWRFE